jgi:hypothetical protein
MPGNDAGRDDMRKVVWIVFALFAVAWTAGAWLIGTGIQWAGGAIASGGAVDLAAAVSHWSLPSWLVAWLDLTWLQSVQLFLVDAVESLREAWPDLGRAVAWLVPVVWVAWGFGLFVLLLLALLGHWLAGRSGGGGGVPPQPRAA